MQFSLRKLFGAAAAVAMCVSSTTAAAATMPVQSVKPLVAISLLGTPASAQAVCSQGASSAVAAAGAAAAAQAQPGCVLPATDVPPPLVNGAPPPPPIGGNFGINWLLLALGVAALLGGISTLFDDDDDVAISP